MTRAAERGAGVRVESCSDMHGIRPKTRTQAYVHALAGLAATALVVAGMLSVLTPSADGARRGFPSAGRAIALTFDDGPDPRYTPVVLDILRAHDARATFFVIGEQAERHPDIVARIVAEGHEVAHHTHSHPHVEHLGARELRREMDACLAVLASQGVEPKWYRPPRKRYTEIQARLAAQRGMKVAMWARCFERASFETSTDMANTLAAETRDGDIVLAHDGLRDRSLTVEALPLYLETIRGRGFEVLTLGELQARGGR
jgi:peptidoglycan/xylan/chitin deacetylase (PgdA/CDA1 family)